jgi:isocitrate lyase
MPRLVKYQNNVLLQSHRIDHLKGNYNIDYLIPTTADMEAGFEDIVQSFELAKNLIESGAAAIHIEDQEGAYKKCGHMGGKVLVPTREMIKKLKAARFAADMCGVDTVIIARTDANSGALLKTDIDPYDRPFVDYTKERTEEGFYHVNASLDQAIARGLAYAPYADMLWCETAKADIEEARKFAEGIHAKYPGKLLAYNCSPSFNWLLNFTEKEVTKYMDSSFGSSIETEMTKNKNLKEAIKNIAQMIIDDEDNGFANIEASISNFNHEDKEVVNLVRNCRKIFTGIVSRDLLSKAYNKIGSFQDDLNKLGYKFQFITLSGFHSLNMAMFELGEDYKENGMLAYVKLQQKEFKAAKRGYREVKHQEAVGTSYYDELAKLISGGKSSTLAMKGSTESEQFKH